MRPARALTAMALLALVAAASCNTVLGVEKLPGEKPVKYAVAACEQCTEKSCVAVERACEADPACLTAYACVAECAADDVRCRVGCEKAAPGALPATYFALDGCRRLACTGDCYGSGGLAFAFGADCNACEVTKCGPAAIACVRSAAVSGAHVGDCERAIACPQQFEPQNPSASLDCGNSSMPTKEFDELVACAYGVSCPDVCSVVIGKDLLCYEGYSWSSATTPQVTFSFDVLDSEKNPVIDANVQACGAIDCLECGKPVAKGKVGADGRATIDIRSGFDGCFQITKDGYLPTVYYPGRPVNHAWGGITQTLLTHADVLLAAAILVPPVTVDDERGMVVITGFDCTFSKTVGASVPGTPGDAETRVVYFAGSGPSSAATLTDKTGMAAIVNLPVAGFDAAMELGGAPIGHWPVVVRKGAVTAVSIFPTTAGR